MLLDTHAWVELFTDSEKGRKIANLIKDMQPATAAPTLAEIVVWARKNSLDADFFLDKIRRASLVLNLTDEISENAGKICFEYKKRAGEWGMVDSFIYATALEYEMNLVTGDPHFRGKPQVIFVE